MAGPEVQPGAARRTRQRQKQKGASWLVISSTLAVLLAIRLGIYLRQPVQLPPEITPLAAPKLAELEQFKGDYEERMLWGTYRSGLYFGMRMRLPKSLLIGLMWFDPDRPDSYANIRHNAQERDGLAKYGWLRHDGASFGRQGLHDKGIRISTTMVKAHHSGSGKGGDWAVRLTGTNLDSTAEAGAQDSDGVEPPAKRRISLLFYIADEEVSNDIQVLPHSAAGSSSVVAASGTRDTIGSWALHVHDPTGGHVGKMKHLGARTPHFHNLTELVQQSLVLRRPRGKRTTASLHLPNTVAPHANLAMFQITAELPFALDLAFVSGLEADTDAERQHTESGKRAEGLTGSALNGLLQQHEAAFDSRFKRTFGSFSAPGTPAGTAEVAKAALSNLLGSIGYFYGSSLIALPPDRSGKPGQQSVVPSWDAPLFTAVPSRSFFPRGFLWDEGFHQLLVRKWDRRLSRDILAHWLDLMNSHGWIAREQILGAEARSRVPADFVVQRPDSANPPTLFLPLSDMASEVAADMAAELDPDPKRAAEVPGKGLRASPAEQAAEAEFLLQAFPRLQAWFGWFNATQAGPVAHSYRWRGRDASTVRELNPKTLTSGLDDYPRASHPTKEERHVDLRCWMALAASSLVSIGTHMGLPAHQVAPYQETVALLGDVASLNALHYDASRGQYLDYGYHTEDVSLKWMLQRAPDGGVVARELRRMVGAPPKLQFVPHFGYVSLFPLLMGLLDKDSPELGQQLEHLRNPELLWTPYGLRSLSATSSMHGKYNTEHDAPYWRGPIWMNLNFLTLRALHRYGQAGGKHAARAGQIYAELRSNVLRNMVEAYAQSGYLWENYDQADGHGKGSHPFTGWTALLVLIGAESY